MESSRSREQALGVYEETLKKIEEWTRELEKDARGQLSGIKNASREIHSFSIDNRDRGVPVDLVVIGEGNAGWSLWFGTSRAPVDTNCFTYAHFVDAGEQYLFRPGRACVFIEASCSGSESGLYAMERERIARLMRERPDELMYVGLTCSPDNHLATIAGEMENGFLVVLPSKSKKGAGDDTYTEIMGDRFEHKVYLAGELLVQELARIGGRPHRDPIREEIDALSAISSSRVADLACDLSTLLCSHGEHARIVVGATDRTSISMKDFVNRMTQAGRECYEYKAVNQPAIRRGDITISASGSGEGTRALYLARDGKRAGATTIGITGVEDSDLSRTVENSIVLPIPGEYEEFFSGSQKDQAGILVSYPEGRDPLSYFRPTIFEKELRAFLAGTRNMVLRMERKPDSWMRKKHN